MVPVGGAIVASNDKTLVSEIAKLYPGRASITPIIDIFITLLSMGAKGFKQLLDERKQMFQYFTTKMADFAKIHNEKLLKTPNNPISFAMSLSNVKDPTNLGAMLFSRLVSGTRIIALEPMKVVNGFEFKNYGAHIDDYPCSYLNASATIGIRQVDVDAFFVRLEKVWTIHNSKNNIRSELEV